MTANRKPADGFTLMEMLVVIVVMGLLVSLIVTRGPPRSPTLVLRGAASGVAEGLRLARGQAIASDAAVPFIIDPATDSFGPPGAPKALPAGVNMTLTPTAAGIIFEPDGSATGGTISLASKQLHVTVTVAWLTGQVDVSQVGAR